MADDGCRSFAAAGEGGTVTGASVMALRAARSGGESPASRLTSSGLLMYRSNVPGSVASLVRNRRNEGEREARAGRESSPASCESPASCTTSPGLLRSSSKVAGSVAILARTNCKSVDTGVSSPAETRATPPGAASRRRESGLPQDRVSLTRRQGVHRTRMAPRAANGTAAAPKPRLSAFILVVHLPRRATPVVYRKFRGIRTFGPDGLGPDLADARQRTVRSPASADGRFRSPPLLYESVAGGHRAR